MTRRRPGAQPDFAVIPWRKAAFFYAVAVVEAPGGAVEVDACPSDAVNLAVLSGAPMAGVRSVSGAGEGGGFCG
jgi:bifunctional DNase/RNase